MKKPIFFFFAFLLFSGCSDFYHLRYKKLDKIPASGFVAPREFTHRNKLPERKIPEILPDTFFVNEVVQKYNLPEKHSAAQTISRKVQHENFPEVKKTSANSIKKLRPVQRNPKSGKKFNGQVLLVFLILLLALFLVVGGAIILVIGISIGYWLPILLGAILIFLGIFPVLGFLGFMMAGDRYHPVENYGDKQQK